MKQTTEFPLTKQLESLWDLASEAHKQIQQDHKNIDPLVGISQNMRKMGVPADVMTIDCLRTRKRILVILHDEQPTLLSYQFASMDKDPEDEFQTIDATDISAQTIYQWIQGYFSQKS